MDRGGWCRFARKPRTSAIEGFVSFQLRELPIASHAGATDISQSEKVWLLRDPQDGSTFHGLIDEFVIFERALTEGEALAFNQSQIDH